jgi:DNA-directed RNA polymerase specialized sigma24 family protein
MTEQSSEQDKFGFRATRWDLVLAARESEEARNELLALYNRPILAFFRALSRNDATAHELRQSFFLTELTRLAGGEGRGVVYRADPAKGRFRDFLKQSLRNHWLSSLRARPDIAQPLPPDDESWHPRIENAERSFARSWVREVVAAALRSVEAMCREKGQEEHFSIFTSHYFPSDGMDPSWEVLASRFGLKDGKTARNRADTVQSHFRRVLADVLLRNQPDAKLSDEVQDVLSILGEDHD